MALLLMEPREQLVKHNQLATIDDEVVSNGICVFFLDIVEDVGVVA